MTTNNPPIAAWAPSTALAKLASRHNNSPCVLTDGPAEFNDVALVRLADYEALQVELADMERDYLTIIEAQDAEHRKQLARLQAECDLLRAAIRRLCNIYVVDDYYDGQLREDRLDEAVNRAIEQVKEDNK